MGLVLQWLAIYALVCMVIMAGVMFKGFDELVDNMPPGTRYDILIVSIVSVILTSPFSVPVITVKVVRKLWQEIIKKCQSSGEDHL